MTDQNQVTQQASMSDSTQANDLQVTRTKDQHSASDKALSLLREGVSSLMSSHGWQDALRFRSKFYNYSFFNSTLIYSQCPTASLVAGYKRWQELGRQVRKGEKGLFILAPLIGKVKGEGSSDKVANPDKQDKAEVKQLFGFRAVYVFDVSQTDGDPLPQLERPKLLEAKDEDINLINLCKVKLLAFAARKGLKVSFDLEGTGALGVYKPLQQAIALKADLPSLQQLKTFIHELAHALLHDLSSARALAELEAESCAFLVCHQLGLDSSSYSFPYLANWTEDLEQLLASGERASVAAQELIGVLIN